MQPDQRFALRILVDTGRIRVLGRLATRPADAATLAAELREPLPSIQRHLDALARAGLAERREADGPWSARPDRIGELGRALALEDRGADDAAAAPAGAGDTGGGAWPHAGESLGATLERIAATPDERKVVRAFLVDGRLVSIPAQGRKRQVILRLLLERVFVEDRDYPEKEVNQRLALFHPDVAALRRYLVDQGLVERSAGQYRRRTPAAAAESSG